MPVDSEHKDFTAHKEDYKLVTDSLAGERAIKKAGEKYVPMLSGQDAKAFGKYVDRGSYYAAFGRSVKGLGGAILRKPAEVDVPKKLEDILENISSKGIALSNIINNSVDRVMSYGRHGILVDMEGEDNQAYLSEYNAEDVINWDIERRDGVEVLTFLVLKEIDSTPTEDDEFEYEEKDRLRVLDIVENKYRVRLYESSDKSGTDDFQQIEVYEGSEKEVFPKMRGVHLAFIPFILLGATELAITPEKPPLLDLANLNISHWRMSVDYHYGLHLCALPTPYAIGFQNQTEFTIGPGKAWQSDDSQASCGFMEFTGEGLGAVRTAMDSKVKEMAAIGARILAEERAGVEAAETARIRQSGESATLTSISSTISTGITLALQYVAQWMGIPGFENIVVKLNTDFIDKKLEPTQIQALLSALQANSISLDTFLYNLQQGEILPEKRTIEEEKNLIETEAFNNPEMEDELPPDEDEPDEEEEEEAEDE